MNFFVVDQTLELLRVPLLTIVAREMQFNFFRSGPNSEDVASVANHTICTRSSIDNFFMLTKLWRCCECRYLRYWREKYD